jgi:hypothetical protein
VEAAQERASGDHAAVHVLVHHREDGVDELSQAVGRDVAHAAIVQQRGAPGLIVFALLIRWSPAQWKWLAACARAMNSSRMAAVTSPPGDSEHRAVAATPSPSPGRIIALMAKLSG